MFILTSLPHTIPPPLSSVMDSHGFASQPAMRRVSWQPKVPPPAERANLCLAVNSCFRTEQGRACCGAQWRNALASHLDLFGFALYIRCNKRRRVFHILTAMQKWSGIFLWHNPLGHIHFLHDLCPLFLSWRRGPHPTSMTISLVKQRPFTAKKSHSKKLLFMKGLTECISSCVLMEVQLKQGQGHWETFSKHCSMWLLLRC